MPGSNAGVNTYARDALEVSEMESGIYEPGTYDFVYLGYSTARYSTNDLKECAGEPYDVSASKHSCEMKCAYPDFTHKVVHNGRSNKTGEPKHESSSLYQEWSKAVKISNDYILNIQYGTIALGSVNGIDGEIYFGDATKIPLEDGSHAEWGSITPVVVSDTTVVLFIEYPGIGIGVITGTIDYEKVLVDFGTEETVLVLGMTEVGKQGKMCS
jgi:hypothetical protein